MASQRRLAVPVITAILVAGFLALFAWKSTRPSRNPAAAPSASGSARSLAEPNRAPAGTDVVALLDGLTEGDELLGWRVVGIYAPNEGIAHVDCQKDGVAFLVGIGRKGSGKAPPPVVLDRYELGWGNVRGSGNMSSGDPASVASAIAERIRRTEKSVPMPAGI